MFSKHNARGPPAEDAQLLALLAQIIAQLRMLNVKADAIKAQLDTHKP
jgi:hypothetical protein